MGVSSGDVLSWYLPRPAVRGGVPLWGDFDLLRLFFFSGVEGSSRIVSVAGVDVLRLFLFSGVEGSSRVVSVDGVDVLFFFFFFFSVEFVVFDSAFIFFSDFGMVL